MIKISGTLQTALGFVGGILVMFFSLLNALLFILGVSAIPDDTAEALGRGADVLDWLLATPWWVSAIVVLGGATAAGHTLASGVKRLVGEQKLTVELPDGTMTAEQARLLLDWAQWARDDYEKFKEDIKKRDEAAGNREMQAWHVVATLEQRIATIADRTEAATINWAMPLSEKMDNLTALIANVEDVTQRLNAHLGRTDSL